MLYIYIVELFFRGVERQIGGRDGDQAGQGTEKSAKERERARMTERERERTESGRCTVS